MADLLATRDGTTHAVKKIFGVGRRIDLPGGHPLTGRFAPDLWLGDGSRLACHGHGGGFLLLDRTADGVFARVAAGWDGRVAPWPTPPTLPTRRGSKPPCPGGPVLRAREHEPDAHRRDLRARCRRS
ncbi:hypothetical protein GCM10027445_44020 [Amycolatopsis endophytica]|uniref:Uncharacterized protein n=1 Tax=Amycolatopsis endophytica TaxID=860233 RepID=A0A853BF79_9PSEU|nr:hypothetical protein [Amycolatopsis endophytica]